MPSPSGARPDFSFSGSRPSNSGWGTRRSPFASANPPSDRIASNAFRCCVVPSRPVAPSMTMPIMCIEVEFTALWR